MGSDGSCFNVSLMVRRGSHKTVNCWRDRRTEAEDRTQVVRLAALPPCQTGSITDPKWVGGKGGVFIRPFHSAIQCMELVLLGAVTFLLLQVMNRESGRKMYRQIFPLSFPLFLPRSSSSASYSLSLSFSLPLSPSLSLSVSIRSDRPLVKVLILMNE